MLSPIARALVRETPAERLAVGIYIGPSPGAAKVFHFLMLAIAVKVVCGVAPGSSKPVVK